MSKSVAIVSLIGLFGAMAISQAADTAGNTCEADDRAAYLCGLQNAEDLILIDNTSWVLVGELSAKPTGGGAYFVNIDDGAVRSAQPDFSAPAAAPYTACPGAPAPETFSAHGLGIRYGQSQVHEVFAINHNERESIEIFDLDVSEAVPRLTWKGCVIAPPAMSANSVAPLPDGGFVVTSFGIRTDPDTYQKAAAGEVSGFVAEWSAATGWSEVPGTLLVANNGIAVSDDGRQLFVTTWGDGKLHIVSRGEIPHTRRSIDLPGLRPDNIHRLADGRLLIAAQAAEATEVFACSREPVCTVGFVVLRFDPDTETLERLLEEPGSPVFGGASGAILVGDEIWVGTFRGDRVARYQMRQ